MWALSGGVRDIRAAETAGAIRPIDGGWSATSSSGESLLFTRLYAGAEFCRHLLPSRARWGAVLALAARRRVPISLTTPPATEDDLPRIEFLMRSISGLKGAEVVVNDWGTLRLARRKFPGLRPVLGRCLRRGKKDARARDIPCPSAMSRDVLDLLARSGVDLVEADWMPDDAPPMALAMHLPFAFLGSGSLCALSGLNRPPREKFLPDQDCEAPCRGLRARLLHPDIPVPLLLKGNTVFSPNGVRGPTAARPEIARFVYDLDTDAERTFLRPRPGGRP